MKRELARRASHVRTGPAFLVYTIFKPRARVCILYIYQRGTSSHMSSWRLLLRTRSASTATAMTAVEHVGEVVGIPDPFSPHVTVRVHPGGEERAVHVAWADRPEGFACFLRLCGAAFRLHVGICAQTAVSYSLYVNEAEAERQHAGQGFLDGEPFVVAAMQTFLSDAVLPKATSLPLPDEEPVPHPEDAAHCSSSSSFLPPKVAWTLPLRPSQRASVDWMHSVERGVLSGSARLVYPLTLPLSPSLAFDPRAGAVVRAEEGSSALSSSSSPFRGAVLANDVGSGKTCCALRMVVESMPKPPPPPPNAPPSSSSLPPLPGPLAGALESGATVVVCPVGMQQHWRDEARKFAPGLRVSLLTCTREAKSISLRTLVEGCDLLVTTPAWIRSKPNTDATDALVGEALRLEVDRRVVRKSVAPASRALARVDPARLEAAFPALGLVAFRRCVVDEAHDVLGPSSARRERFRACRAVRARTWFGLTATPNVSDSSALQEWASVLLDDSDPSDAAQGGNPCLARELERRLIRSFSRPDLLLSSSSSSPPPSLPPTVHRVPLSALERALLEAHSDGADPARTVQLCTHAGAHFHERSHTVEDAAHALLVELDEQIADVEAAEGRGESGGGASMEVDEEEAAVASPLPALLPPLLPDRLQGMRARRERVRHALAEAGGRGGGEASSARSSRGAKLRAAAELVRSLSPDKCIVVASWKPMLLAARDEMHDASVSAELLEGPSARRGAVLRRFREGGTSALLLSSHGGFEGHDLSAASHVVFLHAPSEPEDEARRIEHQVMGRVNRDEGKAEGGAAVHYLVAEGTKEEEMLGASPPSPPSG